MSALRKNSNSHKKLIFFTISLLVGLFFVSSIQASQSGVISATIKISVCGNNIFEGGEQCDGTNLNSQTCVTRGYTSGTLACLPACTFDESACISGGGGGGGGGAPFIPPSGETKVALKGQAYPNTEVTILKDGQVVDIAIADSMANFSKEITGLTPGVYTFSLWAEDEQGRRSITFSFTVTVVSGVTTTASNIFVPPTIDLDKVNLSKEDVLNISGQTAPNSEVTISIESPVEFKLETIADTKGLWDYEFTAHQLTEGMHTTRAKAENLLGVSSSYSKILTFYYGEGGGKGYMKTADINGDGKVNLIDFSIVLYNWGLPKNGNADLNTDNKVNLTDFSILLYYWTG